VIKDGDIGFVITNSATATAIHSKKGNPEAGDIVNPHGMLDYKEQFRSNQCGMSQVGAQVPKCLSA
jgi:hypothetical protein